MKRHIAFAVVATFLIRQSIASEMASYTLVPDKGETTVAMAINITGKSGQIRSSPTGAYRQGTLQTLKVIDAPPMEHSNSTQHLTIKLANADTLHFIVSGDQYYCHTGCVPNWPQNWRRLQ